MKKFIAILMILAIVFTAMAALAEDSAKVTLSGNVQFNMDMDQVMERLKELNLTNPEIEKEKTRGPVEFWELEYENVATGDGYVADIKYLFVGNGLVAVHYDMKDGTSYEKVKAQLVEAYGEAVPFNAAEIGNAKYAIDDDGDLKDCKEMVKTDGLTFVLEQDHDGDVEVTILDPTAAYINN